MLFISASFLASDYCYEKEMAQALQQQAAGVSEVIPVVLRPGTWKIPPLRNLLALPRDGRALSTWQNKDEGAKDIVEGVLRVVAKLQGKQQAPT